MNIANTTLTGPVSISHLVSPDGSMNILLMGDRHNISPMCGGVKVPHETTDVDVWLKKRFDRNESDPDAPPIDFFLEAHYVSEDNDSPHPIVTAVESGTRIDNYIYKIIYRFRDCFSYRKDKCMYKKTRFYSPDVRISDARNEFLMSCTRNEGFLRRAIVEISQEDAEDEMKRLININIVNPLRRRMKIWNTPFINDIIESLRQVPQPYKERLIDYYFENYKGQLEKILRIDITRDNDDEVEKLIDDYCKDVRERLMNAVRKPVGRNVLRTVIFGSTEVLEALAELDMVRMDIFLLSGVFNPTINVQRAIVYTGYLHTKTYLDVLFSMGFKRVFSSESKLEGAGDNQCHDITDLKW
jgi:hypothetical protein